jgi:lipopolysaccharide export system permease protein
MPLQIMQVLPVACLLGTLFVIGQLSRSREYIAGLAGGIPPEKFLMGLFISGLSISFVALLLNETLVPYSTHYARTVFREKIKKLGEWRPRTVNDFFVAGAEGRLWSIKTFDEGTGQADRVVIDTYNNGVLGQQIDSMKATWTNEGWVFSNGSIRNFGSNGTSVTESKYFDQTTFNFPEKPKDFLILEPEPEEMNFKTLQRYINRLSSLGIGVRELEVDLMMKLSFPFSCFIVTLLGVPLALHVRESKAFGVAAAGVLTLLYIGTIQFGKALAQSYIPPLLGAWLGNIIFIVIGTYLWVRLRRTA